MTVTNTLSVTDLEKLDRMFLCYEGGKLAHYTFIPQQNQQIKENMWFSFLQVVNKCFKTNFAVEELHSYVLAQLIAARNISH